MQVRVHELDKDEQVEINAHGHYVQLIGTSNPHNVVFNVKPKGGEVSAESCTTNLPIGIEVTPKRIQVGNAFVWGD